MKNSSEMADMVVKAAKLGAHPAVIRFNKCVELAGAQGLELRPNEGDDVFEVHEDGHIVFKCGTTAELLEYLGGEE